MSTTLAKEKNKKMFTVQNMAIIAMLAAVSTVAYYLIEVPIIPFAPHLKVNFADIPALLGGIILGPLAAIIITVLRCAIHLFKTTTAGIGELVDVIIGISMILPMIFVYKKLSQKYSSAKSYAAASLIAVIATIIGGLISNLILYPVFMYLIIGGSIESFEVFITYLGGTVITNVVRSSITILCTSIFIPFIPILKKAAKMK